MVRGRSGIAGVLFIVVMCLPGGWAQARPRTFELPIPTHIDVGDIGSVAGFATLPESPFGVRGLPGEPGLPWLEATLPLAADSILNLEFLVADTLSLSLPLAPWPADVMTSDTAAPAPAAAPSPEIYQSAQPFPGMGWRQVHGGDFSGHGVTGLVWCPLAYLPDSRRLIVARRATITIDDGVAAGPGDWPAETLAVGDPLGETVRETLSPPGSGGLSPAFGDTPWHVIATGAPLGVEHVIITASAFVEAVRPLARWKCARGIRSGIATIEAVTAQYPGTDAAAAVREYLTAAYAAGLRWAVIGGDETVAPVRYAYADIPDYGGDPYKLQVCDLYFGELDGEWDLDGDGIFGEFFDDRAEIYPELYVGRLPYSTAAEAEAAVRKIIAYERGPEAGDYLARALSVSTDQFRDWDGGIGQHGLVAAAMLPTLAHDLSTMIEAPSGSDPAPSYPDGPTFEDALRRGFGWVNYFAHGRADAFVVRSAGINNWPRAQVFSNGPGGDDNGYLNLVAPTPTPGIHLSAACDQGGFDLDSPPYAYAVGESMAEKLLLMPEGGAAAFVGQSRWGWVASSYKLIRAFHERVADPLIPNHVGLYQTLAKLAYGSMRDLVFGNNLYGDPETPVWTSAPGALQVVAPANFSAGVNRWNLFAASDGFAAPGVAITLSIGDSVWWLGETGADGSLAVEVTLPYAEAATLTAVRAGDRVWVDTLPFSIVSDVFDDEDGVPSEYLALSNYPNPFNDATVLLLGMPAEGEVRIDVFDILGRWVRTLHRGTVREGPQRLAFDARDDAGGELASGVYFARVETERGVVMRKLVLLR